MLSSEDQVIHDCEIKKLSLQPEGTTAYHVKHKDTLRSIAVTYNTTTSALMKLNKLLSNYIFPGQVLFIPQSNEESNKEETVSPTDSITSQPLTLQDEFSFLAPLSPTGTASNQSTSKPFKDLLTASSSNPRTEQQEESLDKLSQSATYNGILKGGSIVSYLLASISSHEEDSEEKNKHEDVAQLERMASYESNHSETFEENFIKMTVHYITPSGKLVRGTLLVTPTSVMFDPDPTDPLAVENGCEKYGIMCNILDITSAAMYNDERGFSRSRSSFDVGTSAEVVETVPDKATEHIEETVIVTPPNSLQVDDLTADLSEPTTKANDSTEIDELSESKLMFEFPLLHSIVKTVGDYLPGSGHTLEDDNKNPTPNASKRNFMHFCIRSQAPMMKTFSLLSSLTESPKRDGSEKKSKSKAKKEVKEGWFQVPRMRSDSLLAFFMQWSPDNYTMDFAEQNGFIRADLPDDVASSKRNDYAAHHDVTRARSLTSSSLEFIDDYFLDEKSKGGQEWEIISPDEAKKRVSMNAVDLANDDSSLLPELLDPCSLLNDDTLLALCKHLPPRSIGYPWKMLYSTDEHGMSLRTLYRKMSNIDNDSPAIILIQDNEKNLFGLFTSSRPRVSDHFYGNGECFLFKLEPEIEFFDWTGENNFFLKGNPNSIMIGGGDGTAGLWIDESVYHGRTRPCLTFNNSLLSSKEDFYIQTLEVWGINS